MPRQMIRSGVYINFDPWTSLAANIAFLRCHPDVDEDNQEPLWGLQEGVAPPSHQTTKWMVGKTKEHTPEPLIFLRRFIIKNQKPQSLQLAHLQWKLHWVSMSYIDPNIRLPRVL
eukprot:scaffold7386_cov160-Amphora_coffeaeformis.AAC.12